MDTRIPNQYISFSFFFFSFSLFLFLFSSFFPQISVWVYIKACSLSLWRLMDIPFLVSFSFSCFGLKLHHLGDCLHVHIASSSSVYMKSPSAWVYVIVFRAQNDKIISILRYLFSNICKDPFTNKVTLPGLNIFLFRGLSLFSLLQSAKEWV